jgi:hypothetical protein
MPISAPTVRDRLHPFASHAGSSASLTGSDTLGSHVPRPRAASCRPGPESSRRCWHPTAAQATAPAGSGSGLSSGQKTAAHKSDERHASSKGRRLPPVPQRHNERRCHELSGAAVSGEPPRLPANDANNSPRLSIGRRRGRVHLLPRCDCTRAAGRWLERLNDTWPLVCQSRRRTVGDTVSATSTPRHQKVMEPTAAPLRQYM